MCRGKDCWGGGSQKLTGFKEPQARFFGRTNPISSNEINCPRVACARQRPDQTWGSFSPPTGNVLLRRVGDRISERAVLRDRRDFPILPRLRRRRRTLPLDRVCRVGDVRNGRADDGRPAESELVVTMRRRTPRADRHPGEIEYLAATRRPIEERSE
jgi:hypothetical protein